MKQLFFLSVIPFLAFSNDDADKTWRDSWYYNSGPNSIPSAQPAASPRRADSPGPTPYDEWDSSGYAGVGAPIPPAAGATPGAWLLFELAQRHWLATQQSELSSPSSQ